MAFPHDPYARIAEAYDAEFDRDDLDVAGYNERRVGARVLVAGCGTGRVNRRLVGAREVHGLDRSASMLARARARNPELTWHLGDLTDFALGPFDEILLPNSAFAFLRSRAERAACLAACRAALTGGGPLTLDLAMPDAARFAVAHTPELPAWEGWVSGQLVRRTREVFRSAAMQELRCVDRFYDESGCFWVSELRLHTFTPDEVQWMLEANGFYADAIYGDHRGGPVREGAPRLLVRAFPIP